MSTTSAARTRTATSSNNVTHINPKRRQRTTPRTKRNPGVVDQVRIALTPANRLPTALGCVLGGFVPIASYFVAHAEIAYSWHGGAMLALVVGGLVFSAKTVWQWGRAAFADPWKASGLVLLLEGIMTLSSIQWLGIAALVLLAAVNAIATGVTLSRS